MRTLVYVGANSGGSFGNMIGSYDLAYAFEPDPEIFRELDEKFGSYSHIHLVNAACSSKEGRVPFYISGNRVASSLARPTKKFEEEQGSGASIEKEIEVYTINLANYLTKEGIEYIDTYVSDCQGSDLDIVRTMKEKFFDKRLVRELYIETHGNGVTLYEGLNNQFDGFKRALVDNYTFVGASFDGREDKDDPDEEPEWDSHWSVKE